MNDPIVFDNVVIRLLKQKDENKSDIFQAQVRQAPIPLHGGLFKANIFPVLDEFHDCFTDRVDLEQGFYNYPTDLTYYESEEKEIEEIEEIEERKKIEKIEKEKKIEKMKRNLDGLADKFHDLLPLSLRYDLPHLIQQVFERGRGVRLIIEASAGDQADRLLSLPWELLFLKQTRVYPARSRHFLIVRSLLDAIRHGPLDIKGPFDVVHVIADDDSDDSDDSDDRDPPIDADLQRLECDTIQAVIEEGKGDYREVTKPGSVEKLLEVMRNRHSIFSPDKPPRPHIIHFLGHGKGGDDIFLGHGEPRDDIFLEHEQPKEHYRTRGYLRFVGENRKVQHVTGEQLQHLLRGTPRVQLVVLNACHGGAVVTSNIALDLVYNGFPYVVAMQDALAQEAAKHFICAFYSELQQGRTIEYAVAAARFEIGAQLPGAIDWCLPVLYTNVGLPDKPPWVQIWGKLDQWLKQVNNFIAINLGLALLHFVAGGLLWLEGITRQLPSADVILWTTGWVVGVPPLLALLIYQYAELPIPSDWSFSKHCILFGRLVGSAALALAVCTLYSVSFNAPLLASVGIWESLSPLSQSLILMPLIMIALLLSSMLTYRSALKFIPLTKIAEEEEIPISEGIGPVIAGYGMLLTWLYYAYSNPNLYTPPGGNLLIGVTLLAGCYVLHRYRSDLVDEPPDPLAL
ncbi:MAG: CHAT domain-containing protein [Ardenticatenaceae bacterium]